MLKEINLKLVTPCIRIIGNLCVVDDKLVSYYIDNGILEVIEKIMNYCTKAHKKEIMWLISNFAANSEQDSCKIVDSSLSFKIILLS